MNDEYIRNTYKATVFFATFGFLLGVTSCVGVVMLALMLLE